MNKEIKQIREVLNSLEEVAKQTAKSPCQTLAMRAIQRSRMWLGATLGEITSNTADPYAGATFVIQKADDAGILHTLNSDPGDTVGICKEMRDWLGSLNEGLRIVMNKGFGPEEHAGGKSETSPFFWSYLGRAEASLREAKMWYGEAMLETTKGSLESQLQAASKVAGPGATVTTTDQLQSEELDKSEKKQVEDGNGDSKGLGKHEVKNPLRTMGKQSMIIKKSQSKI